MTDLTGAADDGRALLYVRPSMQQEDLGGLIRANGWQVDTASDIHHANRLLSDNQYRVGLVHIDGFNHQLIDAEELFAAREGVAWVALAHSESLKQGNLCRIIHENFVDYFTLPIASGMTQLFSTLGHAYGMACLRQNSQVEPASFDDYEMVGASEHMRALFVSIRKVAAVDAPVLISGESGTGKELIARAVHERSRCKKGPFVAVNCGALPENLINSELFGHEKGAFTGASQRKIGWIEAANGGTLFLDEIGDLPLDMQVNLLRFLQEGTIERVGGTQSISVKTRVVAATHVDLSRAVEEGRFREDLFYRLNVLNLHSPPLRDRGQDLELLAKFYFNRFRVDAGRQVNGFTRKALEAINNHSWPGNVREMINRVRRALVMCDGRMITPVDLGLEDSADNGIVMTLEQAREQAEAQTIRQSLARNSSNVSRTARELGVSRVTLYRLMNKHGLASEQDA